MGRNVLTHKNLETQSEAECFQYFHECVKNIFKCLKLSRPWLKLLSIVFRTWFSVEFKTKATSESGCWISVNHVLKNFRSKCKTAAIGLFNLMAFSKRSLQKFHHVDSVPNMKTKYSVSFCHQL